MWRSSVAHTHGVRGVAGSNPVIPTYYFNHKPKRVFLITIFNYSQYKDFCNFK